MSVIDEHQMSNIEKFERAKKIIAREKERHQFLEDIVRKDVYRKSKYPPMNIEPFPHPRQRIPFTMTDEDRALRRQWLNDQHLTAREPRHVPEAIPKHFIRRLYGLPWDWVTRKFVLPAVGLENARHFRMSIGRIGLAIVGVCVVSNYLKHNMASWEGIQGFHVYESRMPYYPGGMMVEGGDYIIKNGSEFYDQKFSERKIMLEPGEHTSHADRAQE